MWALAGPGLCKNSLAYQGGTVIVGTHLNRGGFYETVDSVDCGLIGWYCVLTETYIIQEVDLLGSTALNPFEVVVNVSGGISLNMGPMANPVNGYPAWVGGGSHHLYHDGSGYILRPVGRLGERRPVYDEFFYKEENEEEAYWISSSSGHPSGITLTPKGTATGNCTFSLSSWPRWTCDALCGIYTPLGGATGNKVVGLPRWGNWATGDKWIRSLVRSGDYWMYEAQTAKPDIMYDASRGLWMIGTYGSDAGWWESADEPSTGVGRIFHWTVRVGQVDPPEGENMTIAFVDYVLGSNTQANFIGEAAIWRY